MLYDVTFRCGHTRMVNLTGQYEERQRKILRYNNFVICPDCQMAVPNVSQRQSIPPVWGEADRLRSRY